MVRLWLRVQAEIHSTRESSKHRSHTIITAISLEQWREQSPDYQTDLQKLLGDSEALAPATDTGQ